LIHSEENCDADMRIANREQLCITLLLVVSPARQMVGCVDASSRADSTREATLNRPSPQMLKAPPTPKAGALGQPKSPRQVGTPDAATRATIPPDNPQTPEKISLGLKLFFDRRLSVDGTVACSTCHDPTRAFTDGRPVAIGIKGRVGQRNAPTILNALYGKMQFWDGRVKTLEEQAALPIVNSIEMGSF
jgi:cytochrome c peroxidase